MLCVLVGTPHLVPLLPAPPPPRYLEEILSSSSSSSSSSVVVVLSQIGHRELELLVDFMYAGEVAVEQV